MLRKFIDDIRKFYPAPKRSDNGIYYIYDYIPQRSFKNYSDEQVSITKEIWQYKNNGDEDEIIVGIYSTALMCAVSHLSKSIRTKKIGLVAVPSSKADNVPTTVTTIENAMTWYNDGLFKDLYKCDKQLCNWSDLLKRIEDVPSAHEVPPPERPTYDDHIRTIVCTHRESLQRYRTTFIILDDVTTRGDSMMACRDILLANGLKKDRVLCLSISRTVH